MIQPISQTNHNNIFYKKKTAPKTVQPDIIPANTGTAVWVDGSSNQAIIIQNETRNKLLMTGIGTTALGLLVIAFAITQRGGNNHSKYYGRTVVNNFVSLEKDMNIPTLEKCKSLNKSLKSFLQKQINYAKSTPEERTASGMPEPAKRLLLYGPPGTGKSYFAKVYAKTLGAGYTEIKFSDFNSIWSGEHIYNLTSVMEDVISKATAEPKKKFVVALNEIDSILQPVQKLTKGYSVCKMEERSVVLNYLDEIVEKAPNVTIIGTTNLAPKADSLDGAALSRFKSRIEVPFPEKECLVEALKAHILKMKDGENIIKKDARPLDDMASYLADRKSSFRDLDNLVDSAKNYYLEDYMSNKNAKFKFEYLEKAKKDISMTDGEINRSSKG